MTHEPRITRRAFLRIVGIGGIAGGTAYMLGQGRKPAEATTVSETRLLMGTVVNLTLVTSDRSAGQRAITACLDHMAALEHVLSRHRPESELSRLNRDGQLDAPDPHLVTVLREAVRFGTLTGGAFDVTVNPLVTLYQQHQSNHALPAASAVQGALARVGYQHLDVTEHRIAFARPGMGVTLDGIAKGYIVDQGTSVLQAHGFHNILVEAGGDLAAVGANAARHAWRIGVRQPRDGSQLLHKFSVRDQAVATSGDYMQPYTDDFSQHHILDPRTGYSAPALASATVVSATAMQADALATALMVGNPAQGLELVESLPACEAYLLTKDMRVLKSTGFG